MSLFFKFPAQVHLHDHISIINEALEGRKCLFVGDNGIGKSWILNILLILSQVDPQVYASGEWKEKREAGLKVFEYITEQDLLRPVRKAQSHLAGRRESEQKHAKFLQKLSRYCEGSSLEDGPRFFLPLPVHRHMSTTPVVVSLEWGYTWHVCAQFHSTDWACDHIHSFLRQDRVVSD